MAKLKRAALTGSQRALAAIRQEEAKARKWEAKHRGRVPPSERKLLFTCQYLISRPHRILDGDHDWVIYHALKSFMAKTPWRRHSSQEVAEWVDMFVKGGSSLAEAREEVAYFLKKSIEAVKQAHIRHGRTKRDKSR